MIVLQDTREKTPISFEKITCVSKVIVRKLDFGDYAAIYEPPNITPYMSNLYLERKSLNDLFGTLTSGMERFKKEINRSKKVGADMIIAVEGTDKDVWNGIKHSRVKGATILKTLDTLWLKYHVPTIFCATRTLMASRMVNLWETYYRYGKQSKQISA